MDREGLTYKCIWYPGTSDLRIHTSQVTLAGTAVRVGVIEQDMRRACVRMKRALSHLNPVSSQVTLYLNLCRRNQEEYPGKPCMGKKIICNLFACFLFNVDKNNNVNWWVNVIETIIQRPKDWRTLMKKKGTQFWIFETLNYRNFCCPWNMLT